MVAKGVPSRGSRIPGRHRHPISVYLQAEANPSVLCNRLELVPLDVASGCDPCHALLHLAAGRSRPQQAGDLVRNSLLGAIAKSTIDDRVPSSAAIRLGRPLSKGVNDPFGRLVGEGCESVSTSGVDLAVHVHVLDEELALVSNGGRWAIVGFWSCQLNFQSRNPLV